MKHFFRLFLGNSPIWYKLLIVLFLIINPLIFIYGNHFIAGWLLVLEFILILAMALKCYPLPPGGLLAIEAILVGMTSANSVYATLLENIQVILLLIFMVAAIYFMKDLLNHLFLRILLNIKSKTMLAIMICSCCAFLSAFLDALTVTAVIIAACTGIHDIYHKYVTDNQHLNNNSDLEQFRAFLRSLLMHGVVGTALGGVLTLVGEPQNLVIANYMHWDFGDFFYHVAPVSIPTLICGLITCALLEQTKLFGFGAPIPQTVRKILLERFQQQPLDQTKKLSLIIQAMLALALIFALAFHLAAVGLIGLALLILLTSFTGITEEHQIGRAFTESLPFTALLTVFFAIIAVIHDQHLFTPLINKVVHAPAPDQARLLFIFNGILSAISDNVFVATIYITEIINAFHQGTIKAENLDLLAVAVNTGTNLPSVATPNGQAAFLFLLTSALAPLIRLSYFRMVWMALPYTIVLSATAYTAIINIQYL